MVRMGAIHGIIHTASASAAGVGAGLAQVPGSDSVIIVPIQIAMISLIAMEHGKKVSKSDAMVLIGTQATTMAGRKISQVAIGWIPGSGNVINAITAATLTETLGWAVHKFFEGLSDDEDLKQNPHRTDTKWEKSGAPKAPRNSSRKSKKTNPTSVA